MNRIRTMDSETGIKPSVLARSPFFKPKPAPSIRSKSASSLRNTPFPKSLHTRSSNNFHCAQLKVNKDSQSMDIKLDCRSSFRVGYPRLLSLPLQSDPMQWEHRGLGIHYEPIMAILQDCEVEVLALGLMHRSHTGSDLLEHQTVICLSNATIPGQYEAWQVAVKGIAAYLYLYKHEFYANIEIIDYIANCTILTDIITHNDDEILKLWCEKRGALVRRLSGLEWTAIDIIRWGIREDDLKPTILITASDADEDTWDPVRDDLINLFNSNIRVEIRYGLNEIQYCMSDEELSEFSDEDSDERLYKDELAEEATIGNGRGEIQRDNENITCPITIEAFENSIKMGASISTKEGNSGTLGGFFQIEFHNYDSPHGQQHTERKWVGITNHHVVSKAEDRINGNLLAEPVIIVSPSHKDRENFINLRRLTIHKLNLQIRNPGSKFRARTDERLREYHENRRQTRTTKRIERNLAMQFSQVAGSVLASSGRRGRTNTRYSTTQDLTWSHDHQRDRIVPFLWDTDWALFDLEKKPHYFTSDSDIKHNKVGGEKPCQWQSISERLIYPVAKLGRTSGWTTGNINAAASILRLTKKLSQTQKETNVIVGFTSSIDKLDKPVLVHSIIPDTVKGKPVIEPGDSGSLVLLNEGRLDGVSTIVGLAVGANEATKVSYMNPIDLIIQDIEDVTGGEVVYPVGKGIARDYRNISVTDFVA